MQLRAMGIQGAVEMEFVVDTTGRVDPATLRVISSPDDRFTTAVRSALGNARFVPGRYNGHAVRTLVRRTFEFRLEGRR
jgi:TonB family protein